MQFVQNAKVFYTRINKYSANGFQLVICDLIFLEIVKYLMVAGRANVIAVCNQILCKFCYAKHAKWNCDVYVFF